MNPAAGETPDWPPTRRYGLHHAIVSGDTAYGAWRDAGLVMIDVADRSEPKLIVHRNWSPAVRRRHPQLPAAARPRPARRARRGGARQSRGRRSSSSGCSTSASRRTRSASRPSRRRPRRTIASKGGHFGPHNVHENRPDSFVSSETHLRDLPERRRAGLRHPRPVPAGRGRGLRAAAARHAWSTTARTGRRSSSPATSSSTRTGLVYANDYNGGLYILEWDG